MKKAKTRKKRYEKPTATKLTPEQARLKLTRYADKGDEGAKELLNTILDKDSEGKKKSA
jgi:hypothetical protein